MNISPDVENKQRRPYVLFLSAFHEFTTPHNIPSSSTHGTRQEEFHTIRFVSPIPDTIPDTITISNILKAHRTSSTKFKKHHDNPSFASGTLARTADQRSVDRGDSSGLLRSHPLHNKSIRIYVLLACRKARNASSPRINYKATDANFAKIKSKFKSKLGGKRGSHRKEDEYAAAPTDNHLMGSKKIDYDNDNFSFAAKKTGNKCSLDKAA